MSITSLSIKKTVYFVNYLINISSTRANFKVTSKQFYNKTKPQVYHFKVFKFFTYLYIPKEDRIELKGKKITYIFLGYDIKPKAKRLYDPIHCKIWICQDIVFDKTLIDFEYIQRNTILT